MSLTNIVYTPVDTGTAKVRPNVENTKMKDIFLVNGGRCVYILCCSCRLVKLSYGVVIVETGFALSQQKISTQGLKITQNILKSY